MAGLWSAALASATSGWRRWLYEQMKQLPFHALRQRSHEPTINLAEKLKAMAPVEMSKVFFANSGSRANDTVVKMVWYMNNALGRPTKEEDRLAPQRLSRHHRGVGQRPACPTITAPSTCRSGHPPYDHATTTAAPRTGETEQFATRCAEVEQLIVKEGGADQVAAMICSR